MTDALIHSFRCERCGRSYNEAVKRLLAAGEAPCPDRNAEADVAVLMAALRPFADFAAAVERAGHPDTYALAWNGSTALTLGDCRRARAALARFGGATDAG